MIKIIITARNLRSNNKVIDAIHFARLLNSLQSTKRTYLVVERLNEERTLIDKLELIICHSAVLYESIKELWKQKASLARLEAWKRNQEAVNTIKHEYTNSNSFSNSCLKVVRNKIYFHFDKDVVNQGIMLINENEDLQFAQSETEYDHDIAFTLSEEVIMKYLINKINIEGDENSKWDHYQYELFRISQTVTGFLSSILVELIKPFSRIVNQ